MPTVGKSPVLEEWDDREREKRRAVEALEALARKGLLLKHHAFFVPGWTSEDGSAWRRPYTRQNTATSVWIKRIFRNATEFVEYVNFTAESPKCASFYDFGRVVRQKIGDRTPCDCIGHSMGGLDIAAAISLCEPPLLNVQRFIAFGSPLRGTELGEFRAKLGRLLRHHRSQVKSMDPDQPFIKRLRIRESLKHLLDRLERIYCLYGTRDMAIQRGGRIDYRDIDPDWKSAPPRTFKEKVRVIEIPGADHTGRLGITQDPRAVLWLVRILGDLPFPEKKLNYGYLIGGP